MRARKIELGGAPGAGKGKIEEVARRINEALGG
jgi:hypothetical protein